MPDPQSSPSAAPNDTAGSSRPDHLLFERMLDGFALHEMIFNSQGEPADYRFLAVNPAFESITGLKAQDIVGRTVLEVLPNLERHWIENYGRVVVTGEPFRFENHQADLGKHFDVVAYRPMAGRFACIFRDVTKQKENEKELRRLLYLNEVLSQINQSIVRATTREELFSAVCRVSHEYGHFCLTWIGLLDPHGAMLETCESGEAGRLFPIRADECRLTRESVGAGRPSICNVMAPDQADPDCHLRAMDWGVRSCAAFPIRSQGKICGSLCVHSSQEAFFRDAEVSRLEEAALDISSALDRIDADTAWRQAEEALRESEAFRKRVFDGSRVPIVMLDAATLQCIDCNQAAVDLYGFGSRENTLSQSPREAWPATQYDGTPSEVKAREYASAALAEGVAVFGWRHRRPNGEIWDAEVHLMSFQSGGRDFLQMTLQDITERRRAARALRESEERYRKIAKCVPDPIWTMDLSGKLTYANSAVQRTHGWTAAEYVNLNLRDTVTPRQFAISSAMIEEELTRAASPHYDRNTIRTFTSEQLRKDGSSFWAEVNAALLWSDDGKPAGIIGTTRDITGRMAAEAALRESEERYRALFERSLDCVYLTDFEGHILDANQAALDMLGYRRQDLPSLTFASFLSEDQLIRAFGEAREIASGGQQRGLSEYRLRHRDGRDVFVEIQYSLIYRNGKPAAIQGIARNITERKLAEVEREKLWSQLTQSQKMESVGRLAGGVAHDFNNLLTVINGYSEMTLENLPAHDPLRSGLDEIRKAGGRAADLTRQLLAFSRKQVIEPRPVNLNDLIADSRGMLERLLGEDIQLVTDLDPRCAHVMADPGQLNQVLMNLIVNARDAMPEGGQITLSSSRMDIDRHTAPPSPDAVPGKYVVLAVSDTGEGMSEEVQRNMFEPFFTTKAEGSGTGLGLATVYGIVRQTGGWIQVESHPGMGTTFRIGLPLLEQTELRPIPEKSQPTRLDGSETILVVEDQEEVRKLALAVLKSFHYQTLEASSGKEALLVAERHPGPIHLLLTDVVMPLMTGKELAERLRPGRPGMKVLYMSGYTGDVISRHGVLDPGVEYMEKPFSPEALARKVRIVLDQARSAARVLVVDDEESIRGLFAKVLTRGGYHVSVAADGGEAEAALQTASFDLVITDLVMPNREGIETICALRKSHPELKIIAVSGAFGGSFLKTAALLGADATLIKPVSPDQLLESVRKALE